MNRWLVSGILAAMGAVGIVPWLRFWKAAPDPRSPVQTADDDKRPHVEIAHPQRKTIHRKLKVAGEVRPNQEIGIYARVQGYVDSIGTGDKPVDRGTWVKKGDLLVKISVPEIEKTVEKEQTELAACRPSLLKAEAERDWRKAIWERLDGIAKKTPNVINQEQLDDAAGRYRVADAEVKLTEARTKTFEAAVERTQAMLDFATICAPFDGVITERWVDPGLLVQPATTKMLHLAQGDVVRTRVHIPQSDVPSVRADCTADVTVDELPGRHFQAKLSRVFWGLSRETKTMAVEIDIKNDHPDRDRWVRPGMFARVTIDVDPRQNVLVLPASALVIEKKKMSVFVVRDGVVKKTAIAVGVDNGIEVEVTQGVEETDDVVVGGKNLISDGEKVRVTRK